VQTRASAQDAATAKDGAHGPPRGALGRRCRRTAVPLLPRTVCGEMAGGAGDGGVVPPQGRGRRRVGDARGKVPAFSSRAGCWVMNARKRAYHARHGPTMVLSLRLCHSRCSAACPSHQSEPASPPHFLPALSPYGYEARSNAVIAPATIARLEPHRSRGCPCSRP
jgi:hypothetical protein